MADIGKNKSGANNRDIIVTMRLNNELCKNISAGNVYDVTDPKLKGLLIDREKGNYVMAQVSNIAKSGSSVRPLPPEQCDPNPTLTNMPAVKNGCYITKEKVDNYGNIKTVMVTTHSDSYSNLQINKIFETGGKVNITRAKGETGGLYATTVVNANMRECGQNKPNSLYIDTNSLKPSQIPIVTNLNEVQYFATCEARKWPQKQKNLVKSIMAQYGDTKDRQNYNEMEIGGVN